MAVSAVHLSHLGLVTEALNPNTDCMVQDDLYKPDYYLSLLDFREQTLQRLKKFCEQRFFSTADYTKGAACMSFAIILHKTLQNLTPPAADPLKFQAGLECLALSDYSLSIKAGVHFTLCGGAIAKLGTQKHFDALFERLDTLDLPGCFGMTELGHGSNVMGLETQVCLAFSSLAQVLSLGQPLMQVCMQATYDADSQEFIIHTPADTASKFWIGGAAQHGRVRLQKSMLLCCLHMSTGLAEVATSCAEDKPVTSHQLLLTVKWL